MPEFSKTLYFEMNPTFDQLATKFQKVGYDINETIRAFVTEFAFSVQRYAKQLTPVKTGFLRSNIVVWNDIASQGLSAWVGVTTVPYAYYVHEGTERMRARPFMKWGLDYAEGAFSDNELNLRIDKKVAESLYHI